MRSSGWYKKRSVGDQRLRQSSPETQEGGDMGVEVHEEEGQVGRHEECAKKMASDSRLLSLSLVVQ